MAEEPSEPLLVKIWNRFTRALGSAQSDATQSDASELEESCERYAGRTLVVEPLYGHGWRHEAGNPFADNWGVPPPFHVRVLRLYRYRGDLRGIVARISEPGFMYDGFWLVSVTRYQGTYNFTSRWTLHDLLICPEEPIEDRSDEFRTWPVTDPRGYPKTTGCGSIAESLKGVR
jgi:hypothetical protein